MSRQKFSLHFTDGFEACDYCGLDIVADMRVNDLTLLGVVCGACCGALKILKPSAIAIGPEACERNTK